MKQGYVYILTNRRNGTLYTGVTTNLAHRVWQHRVGAIDGFTKKYHVICLVYVEAFDTLYQAIQREKRIKKWKRAWKLSLIEKQNPDWIDLYDTLR
jgi:putative endonuclease